MGKAALITELRVRRRLRARKIGRVRAAADWLEGALDNGEFTLDEQLTQLLEGEEQPVSRRPEARPLAEHHGDLVRVALMEARPAGLHTYQLIAATRLTKSQVARGIRHVRDIGAAENPTPIIRMRKDGYMFSDDPADWIEYDKRQFRQILGRLTRVITGTLAPHLARYPR